MFIVISIEDVILNGPFFWYLWNPDSHTLCCIPRLFSLFILFIDSEETYH